ncbi:hypothetical protein H4R19_003431 [Coemansia spiralis]|nr:hypothetical protein H4R19_003431 [Coemansia spiralis]
MSFKVTIRRTCVRWARTCARVLTRSSVPTPVPAPAPVQAFTPIPAPLPAAAEWAASVSSMLSEIIDAADAPAPADSVPAIVFDATPAPAVTDADEAAAAQWVPDKAPTTGSLRQRAQQYNVARQPAAECSKSEGLMLRCIKLEDEAAPSASGHSSNRSSTCTIVGDYNEIARMREQLAIATTATTVANQRAAQAERALANSEAVAAAAAATADAAAVDAASALEDAIDRAERAERAERDKLYLARLVALASINADSAADDLKQANDRADRAERDLARFKARAVADAASADRALKHANERTQEYAKARSATSASNRKLQQLLGKKGRELVAALTELDTTRQMLSDTRNELAAERHTASERANANTRQTNDLVAANSRLVCDFGEMAGMLDEKQGFIKYIIRTVRDWVMRSECRCTGQVRRRELLSWLASMDG